MFIDDMKKSILQRAIQWKLVEQNQNDEPASELLKRIREEKERLIKDGKIKKEKPLAPITDEEKPFDIPSSWEWVRYGEIAETRMGKTILTSDMWDEWYPVYSATQDSKPLWYVKYLELELTRWDLVIPARWNSIWWVTLINDEKATCTQTTMCSKYIKINSKYLYYCCYANKSTWFSYYWAAIPQITVNQVDKCIIPIPPIEEQKRIADKLDIIMSLLDEAKPLEEEITKLEKEFPSKLRQAILQSAIKGELAINNTDELASELLKRIREEKENLIKDGKIKKEKAYLPVSDEEKFLDLWWDCIWVRLWEIAKVDKWATWIMKAIPWEYPMYTTAEQPITHNEYQVDWKAVMIPLVSSTGHWHASMKRLHYWEWKFAVGSILSIVQPYWDIISAKYLYCYLSTFKERLLVSQMKGMANVTLSIDAIKNVAIPIPSTENQKKLEELVMLCDELEEQIG